MKKDEYIAKYGDAAYEQQKQLKKKWYQEHKEHHNQLSKKWKEEHREHCKQLDKKWHAEQHKNRRINGCTRYCKENYELIENYELAKTDNFDPKKWHLHHQLENYWSSATLIRKGLYYDVNPEALIWLPYEEHMKDRYCKDSKWHKRSLENE